MYICFLKLWYIFIGRPNATVIDINQARTQVITGNMSTNVNVSISILNKNEEKNITSSTSDKLSKNEGIKKCPVRRVLLRKE